MHTRFFQNHSRYLSATFSSKPQSFVIFKATASTVAVSRLRHDIGVVVVDVAATKRLMDCGERRAGFFLDELSIRDRRWFQKNVR